MALPVPRMLIYTTPAGSGLTPDNPTFTGTGINLFDDSYHPDGLPLSPNWSIAAIRPSGAFVAPLVITGSHGSPASVNVMPDLRPGIQQAEIDIRLLVKSASGSAEIIRTIHVKQKGATAPAPPPPSPAPAPPPPSPAPVTGSVTWDEPVINGVARRRVGDPSGAHIRISGPAGTVVTVRNRGPVTIEAPVTIPSSGVWAVDDRTPVPATYLPGIYDMVIVSGGYEQVIGRFEVVSDATGDLPPIHVGGQNPPPPDGGGTLPPDAGIPPPAGGGGGGGGGGSFPAPEGSAPTELDLFLGGVLNPIAPAPVEQNPPAPSAGGMPDWIIVALAAVAGLLLMRR